MENNKDLTLEEVEDLAIKYFDERDYEKSIERYTKIIDIDKEYEGHYYNRAISYFYNNNITNAINDLKQAISIKSGYYSAYSLLANCYEIKGELDLAIDTYLYCIKEESNTECIYEKLALCYITKGDFNTALEYLNKASNSSDSHTIHGNIGYCHYQLLEFDKAIDSFSIALSITNNDPQLYVSRGSAYFKIKDYQKAEDDYLKSIELDNQLATGYYNLACVSNKKNANISQILKYLNKAIELDSNYKQMALDDKDLAKIFNK
jgi:tetratricopeptide (TPR) repeat protein